MTQRSNQKLNKKFDQVFAILGPTATGKTDLAMELIKRYPFEIISVDSAMVYQDMNIGTAKPTSEELLKAPHHLINLRRPDQIYSVADFCQDVNKLIPEILARNKFPLLVGGTMMYFNALKNGLNNLPGRDEIIRTELSEILKQEGTLGLHERLKNSDPEAALRIKPQDTQRLMRALEIFKLNQKKANPNNLNNQPMNAPLAYPILSFGLVSPDIPWQRERMTQRFNQMLKMGLVQELEFLKLKYVLNPDLPSMRCVGYRQAWDYLEGNLSYEDLQERGVISTAQLAKRQRTWLRSFDWAMSVNPQQRPLDTICLHLDSRLPS